MRFLIFLGFLFWMVPSVLAQDGFNTGFHVRSSFQLNSHRDKNTGIWSSESGYGFSLGVPLRFGYAEDRAFCTGADYEYIAYDNWAANTLVGSFRLHSVHVPATIHFNLISTWFISAGTGINMVFRSRQFTPGSNVDNSYAINPIQPYISLGLGTCSPRGNGLFELGIQARHHFINIYNKTYTIYDQVTSKIVSFDLVMRFYL